MANNLNQLAKAVNIGVLPVTPETAGEIAEACVAVIAMRGELLRALGLPEGGRQ
ncbi:MAG: plasmid mobilization relaxosome protein MobC [Rhizobiaceae bacterium]